MPESLEQLDLLLMQELRARKVRQETMEPPDKPEGKERRELQVQVEQLAFRVIPALQGQQVRLA